MKTPSISPILGVCVQLLSALTVSAVSLSVSPNLQQFFTGSSSVSLSCVDDGWTVRRTRGGLTEDCGKVGTDFEKVNSSFCRLYLSISSNESYFCEDSSGQQSDKVSISVIDKGVILEIPALPVMTGSDVTLSCKPRDGSRRKSYFSRDDVKLGSRPEGELVLSKVKQADEGLYSCTTDLHPHSPKSRLRVRDPPLPPTTTASPPISLSTLSSSSTSCCTLPPYSSSPDSLSSSSFLPFYLLVLLVLVPVLVGAVVLWRKQRVTKTSPPPVEVTYADVNIRQKNKRKEKRSADPDSVYSGVRTHTAGPAEVTYGQVEIRSQRPAGRNKEYPVGPDVVYSSVRAGK